MNYIGIGFWGADIDTHGAYWTGPASESNSIHEQFTGLKDKNGREIYEGDKVFVVIRQTVGEEFRGEAEIEWGDTFGCWMLDFPDLGQSMGLEAAEEIEVIGNIHEGFPGAANAR